MPQIQLKLEVSPSPGDIAWWGVTVLATPTIPLNPQDFTPINAAGFFVWDHLIQANSPLRIQFNIAPLADTANADCYVFMNGVYQNHPLVCTADDPAAYWDYPLPIAGGGGAPAIFPVAPPGSGPTTPTASTVVGTTSIAALAAPITSSNKPTRSGQPKKPRKPKA